MQPHELTPLVEALLFAADQPLTPNALRKAVDDDTVTAGDLRRVLETLAESYEFPERGFRLVKLGGGYQIVTRERYAPWIEAMLSGRRRARLSRAALETAAVIAYKQPITRLEIERIRGVDVGGVLGTLLERDLILIKGRDPGPGRPLLYGTTQGFLEYFGLARLADLPRLDEIAALAREETASIWDERELLRFEKHGVPEDAIPPVAPAEPEAGAPEPGEGAAGEPAPEDREADRAEFRELVSDLAGPAPEEAAPPEEEPPADGPPV